MIRTRVFVIIIAVILAICAVIIGVTFGTKNSGNIANVYVDGQLVYSVDLSKVNEPFEKEIVSEYGRNILRIEKGKIAVIDADCDGKECISTGFISESSKPIVCLPHRLVIKIEKEGEVDTVST